MKSQNNCFAQWKEKQWYSPDWYKANLNAQTSRISTQTVDEQRKAGRTKSNFYGTLTVDLDFKPHGGAYTKAKAKK